MTIQTTQLLATEAISQGTALGSDFIGGSAYIGKTITTFGERVDYDLIPAIAGETSTFTDEYILRYFEDTNGAELTVSNIVVTYLSLSTFSQVEVVLTPDENGQYSFDFPANATTPQVTFEISNGTETSNYSFQTIDDYTGFEGAEVVGEFAPLANEGFLSVESMLQGYGDAEGDTLSVGRVQLLDGTPLEAVEINGEVVGYALPEGTASGTTISYLVETDGFAGTSSFTEGSRPVFRTLGDFSAEFPVPSGSVVEQGVEGQDFFYANALKENRDNDRILKRGEDEITGHYWVNNRDSSQTDNLVDGGEYAVIMGRRGELTADLTADEIIGGLESGDFVATKSFTSYGGYAVNAAFADGQIDSLVESANPTQTNNLTIMPHFMRFCNLTSKSKTSL